MSMEWRISDGLVDYESASRDMETRVAAIHDGTAGEQVWLLEHPPLYTAGTSAKDEDLIDAAGLPVYRTGRGGQFTYHGPGQRVGYVMLDLKRHGGDIRRYVHDLEEWLIRTLARFQVKGERREGRVGIWVVERDGSENKIAAIGVRVRHWVTFHGVSLNVEPDLKNFDGIVPCGILQHGVTSLAAQGILVSMPEVDAALRVAFGEVFGAEAGAIAGSP
ncbi:MAG TPA: lipoyl(octanoyl) transferase LipB [Aliidongia sp.]|uniref:lipoyl(octanoyl) transferase LipB n=1 Tax=Aliidongia sp. TaxID=1914230 RepID=UPI002DDD6809|nr:lipoyl(octanoyl) transferase LipB [Aliidongia sp.]HEV2674838.1 lipoyl(octanoyl) transferase LipB [Aliidongia sp.]